MRESRRGLDGVLFLYVSQLYMYLRLVGLGYQTYFVIRC